LCVRCSAATHQVGVMSSPPPSAPPLFLPSHSPEYEAYLREEEGKSENRPLLPPSQQEVQSYHPPRYEDVQQATALPPTRQEGGRGGLPDPIPYISQPSVDPMAGQGVFISSTPNRSTSGSVTGGQAPADAARKGQATGKTSGGTEVRPAGGRSSDPPSAQSTSNSSKGRSKGTKKGKKEKERNRGCCQVPVLCICVTIVDTVLLGISLIIQPGFVPLSENPMAGPSARVLSEMGAKNDSLIEEGELWRIVTPMFLHAGVFHWAMNTIITWVSVRVVELHIFGTWRTFFIYILSGTAGNLASAVFLPGYLSVGASSSIFGCIGAALGDAAIRACFPTSDIPSAPLLSKGSDVETGGATAAMQEIRQRRKKEARKGACKRLCSLFWQVILIMFVGLLPFIDNFAHVGGLLEGLFLGIAMTAAIVYKEKKTNHRKKDPTCCLIMTEVLFAVVAPAAILAGLVVLYLPLRSPHEWCPFCRYINCLPVLDWCEEGY